MRPELGFAMHHYSREEAEKMIFDSGLELTDIMAHIETWARGLYWLVCGLSFLIYPVRDRLTLRLLTITNCLLIIPYHFFIGEVSMEPIAMAGVIVIINLIAQSLRPLLICSHSL